MICSYIDEYKEDFGAEPICATLRVAGVKIAPSTYYARKHRRPSARKKRDEILKEEISRVHANNYDVVAEPGRCTSSSTGNPIYRNAGMWPDARSNA